MVNKRHSEKSKTWEKIRRDRLNVALEELSKELPKYDPSVTWSKIEVIQKATEYLKEIKERRKKAFEGYGDREVLEDFRDLIEANAFFQSRNKQLTELLKKANINLPHFDLPKIIKTTTTNLKENLSYDFQFKSLKRNQNVPAKPLKNKPIIVSNDEVTTIPTGVLVPVKVIKLPESVQPNLNKRTVRKRKISQNSDQSCQYVKLYSRRDGKLPIPTLKRKCPVKKKFKRRKRARKDCNLPPTSSIRIESPTANFLMNFPVVKSGGKNDPVDDLHEFLMPPPSYKEVNSFTSNSVISQGKPQIARNLFNTSVFPTTSKEEPTSASFNCVIVPAENSMVNSNASNGRITQPTSSVSYMSVGKPQCSIPLPSFNTTTQGLYSLGDEKSSIIVSSDKPIVFAEPNNVLVISSKKSQNGSDKKSTTKYYFEEPATNFTFNLTNTTNSQPKDTNANTNYYHKPWIPPPSLYSNSSQPAAFTFSLTPTTNSVVNSQTSTTINFTFSLTNTTTTKEINSNKKVFYDCEKQQKSHVNWMTTASNNDTTYAQDYTNLYPNPVTNSVEENYFYTWSPIKGERAQNSEFWAGNENKSSPMKKSKVHSSSNSNNQPSSSNIFSVSQLVDEGNGHSSKKVNSYSAEALLSKKEKNKHYYSNNFYNSGTNGGDFSYNNSTSTYANFSNFSNQNFENTDYFEFLNPTNTGKTTNSTSDWLPLDGYSGNFHHSGSTNWQSTNFFEPMEFNANHQVQNQQNNSSSTNNISNFNLSSICPEINSEDQHQQQHHNQQHHHQKIGNNSNSVW